MHLFTLLPQTYGLYQRAIASSGSMLNPWSISTKNHTQIIQQLIATEQRIPVDDIGLEKIIDYLNTVNGTIFGERTFFPVYESGAGVKEINLVWAPTIERKPQSVRNARSFHS